MKVGYGITRIRYLVSEIDSAFQGLQFPWIAADGAVLLSGSQRKLLEPC